MSRRIRRTLATAGLMAALFLALPAPSTAAGPWEPAASARLTVRVWSWLESLGLTPRQPEKQGSMIDPNGGNWITVPSAPTGSEQGSGIDPNGGR
ncbi:MAG TPA: hypothetical protein VKK31_24485 [Thermoanaerobaculia bacterium]|nr:hypothetical protein [Thermoanaerobaculia bacterium]